MEADGFACSHQLMPNGSKYYFYPYQLPLTPYFRRSKLTGYGVNFFFFNWLTIFWSMGAGKLFMGDSSSRHSINAGTQGAFLLALFLTRALLRLPRTFSPIYTLPPSPHSPISTLLILLRESSPSLLSLDCPLLPSTCC